MSSLSLPFDITIEIKGVIPEGLKDFWVVMPKAR
jgi:hypothetical protein